jgi:DNA-binding response OmpR family regulator
MNVSHLTILLVEDDPNDIFLIQRAFKKANIANPIKSVSDGEQAMAYLSGEGEFQDRARFPLPGLILLDLKLPRKSGLEVLTWIRAQTGPVRRIPIIMLTSSRQTSDVNRAYDLGANSYLVKPVAFEGLLQVVQTIDLFWIALSEKPEI